MTDLEQAKAKLIDTIGRYNLTANNVAKFKFNERETEMFCKMMVEFTQEQVKPCSLGSVSGTLPLTDYAKEKLEYINGNCIARDFPNEQPTKEWAGAVLDLLEELKLGNYR